MTSRRLVRVLLVFVAIGGAIAVGWPRVLVSSHEDTATPAAATTAFTVENRSIFPIALTKVACYIDRMSWIERERSVTNSLVQRTFSDRLAGRGGQTTVAFQNDEMGVLPDALPDEGDLVIVVEFDYLGFRSRRRFFRFTESASGGRSIWAPQPLTEELKQRAEKLTLSK